MPSSSATILFELLERCPVPVAILGQTIEELLLAAHCTRSSRLPPGFRFRFARPAGESALSVNLYEADVDDPVTLVGLRQAVAAAGLVPADLWSTLRFLAASRVFERRCAPLLCLDHAADPEMLVKLHPISGRVRISVPDLTDGLWGRYLFLALCR